MFNITKSHVRFDWAAKKILRSKANFGILEGFLSELFKEDVKIKSLLSEEGNKESQENKSNRVDLLIENSKGEIIIVEIQNTREIDYLFRVLFGTSKVINEYMKEGSPYKMVKKVITISIVYFNFGQGKDYLYKGQTTFEGVNQHDIFELSEEQKALFKKETVSDIFPFHYLIRVNQFDDIAKNTIDEWIYFFKNSEIKPEFKAKGIQEAREKLKAITMNPKQIAEYKRYLDVLSTNASIAETIAWDIEWEKRKAEKAIKEAEMQVKEAEMQVKEAEMQVKEAEMQVKEAEMQVKEAETKKEQALKEAEAEKEQALKEAEAKKEQALKEAEAEKEQALKKQKFDIAIDLAKKYIISGFTNDIIKIGTDLTDEDINKLRENMNENK